MIKLTVVLCIAIYACMVIFSDEDARPVVATAPEQPGEALPQMRNALHTEDGQTTLTTTDGRVLQIAAVVMTHSTVERAGGPEASATLGSEDTANTPAQPSEAAPQDAAPTETTLPLVAVTGSRVNLRSGPSTDSDILDALVEGTQAELLETLPDGWAQIRVVASGLEGYMADRFLAPVN